MYRVLKYPVPYPLPGRSTAAPFTAHAVGYGYDARKRLHIRLNTEERELLEQACSITQCSMSEFARWSIRYVSEAVIKEHEEVK